MRKFLVFFYLPLSIWAQDSVVSKGKDILSGQWRTFYSATSNKGSLKDYHALATGGKLKYQYRPIKNLELGGALYNTTNLGIQDLTVPDAVTGSVSRYEEGLFNRLDLSNEAVFVLGELYLTYTLKRNLFTIGRMKINTPLINPLDGRMIPTLVQGLWFKHRSVHNTILQVGLLNGIAPRSTGQFYGIGESVGTYPVGRNRFGQASQYAGNTASDFIILVNADVKLSDKLQLGIWNYYTDNISNSLYIKPKWNLNRSFSLAGEWLHQNKVGDGGNRIDALRYFNQNTSDVLGAKFEYTAKTTKLSLAYDRILPGGQFIAPREWGREDLFSFQKRERSEGTADNHALVFDYSTSWALVRDKANIRSIISLGRHWKPAAADAVQNKYAMPDYTQLNVDLFFDFMKLKHLQPEILFTAKMAHGDFMDNANFYYNKTDMAHLSVILNYNF